MNWYALFALLILVGLPLFLEWFPKRSKCSYVKDLLKNNAKIKQIFTLSEGSPKHKRLRTFVLFDDGFKYSACRYSRTGLFTIQASKDDQLEVVKSAIKKHTDIIKTYNMLP